MDDLGIVPYMTCSSAFWVPAAAAAGAGPGGEGEGCVTLHWRAAPGTWVPARADGCPVGAPRAVMNIKHPCNPKPVSRGMPIAILLQYGSQDSNVQA